METMVLGMARTCGGLILHRFQIDSSKTGMGTVVEEERSLGRLDLMFNRLKRGRDKIQQGFS